MNNQIHAINRQPDSPRTRLSDACLVERLSCLTLHVVNIGSIPVGSSHSEVRLLIHLGDVLKSGPKAWRILRSGLNLEGMDEPSTDFLFDK